MPLALDTAGSSDFDGGDLLGTERRVVALAARARSPNSVERRTGEIGIRMALGASRGAIAGPILREALSLAAPGVVLGLIAAVGAGKVIRHQLYGIQATDPLSLFGAGIALVTVALAAAWIPARCAVRVDPIIALRPDR